MGKKRIDRWIDGDSGYFTDGTEFRLANVRAPEKYQFGGSRATKIVSGMSGRSDGYVNVRVVGRSYGRAVVTMSNSDGSINTRMKRKGYTNRGR
jgi:endonuclease YncB( thermonuclease family)